MRILPILFFLLFLANLSAGQSGGKYSLRKCIEIALENNITLKQSKQTAEGSEVGLAQAKYNRYPNLNGNVGQALNFGRSVNPFDNTVVENQRVNSNNMSLSTSVNLFSGFQNTYTVQQRALNLKASKEDVETNRNNVVLGVVQAFASLLSAQAQWKNTKAQLENSQIQLERTSKLVKAGSLPIGNELDLKAQLAIEETNLVVAENNVEMAKLALSQWMQIEADQMADIEEPQLLMDDSPTGKATDIYRTAEPNQPQIQAAKTRVLSAEKGIQLAKSSFYPNLNLQAGLFTNYSSIARRFVPGTPLETPILQPITSFVVKDINNNELPVTVYQKLTSTPGTTQELNFQDQFDNNLRKGVSLNLNIPIFNGFQTRFAIQNAQIQKKLAELRLDQERNQLRQTIETAVTNEKAARKRLLAIEKQISALEEAFRSAEQRYNVGVLNSADYLIAKNNLARAQMDHARFKYDFFLQHSILDFYLGKELNFN